MFDDMMPKSLQDHADLFMMMMVAAGVAIDWLNNRGRQRGGDGTPTDGWLGDDGPHHDGWWSGGGGL